VIPRGVGLGLRAELFDDILKRILRRERLPVDFFEVAPENFMNRGGRYPATLRRVLADHPVVTHGLTLSLGGHDALGDAYLRDLRALVADVGSPWHSDHMCFGAADGRRVHELLPVALKRENVRRIADRIRRAQDAIGAPLAIENVSYYWHPGAPEMGEAEFLSAVCDAADCGLLLDVNNAYVNAVNFGFDVDGWMAAAPLGRVVQIHVAGHQWFAVDESGVGEEREAGAEGAMIVDTHGAAVADPVLALLGRVLARTGPVPVLLERDQNVPELGALLAELARVREVFVRSTRQPAAEQHTALA
jgi:uncharacterized protein (UPF0276 family)